MKRFLLARCGNASLAGFELVADILENYTYPIRISNVYKELSEKYNLNTNTIGRRIEIFKNACGYKEISNHEFISILMIEAEN